MYAKRMVSLVDRGDGDPSCPIFTSPLGGHVDTKRDFELLWLRIEHHCARFDSRQRASPSITA